MSSSRIPVTVLTGYLGAGKTTLLNRILSADHGQRFAVIVNEFGAIGIDHELIVGSDEELFEMNNGCICCTVRGDLIRTLHGLLARPGRFDAVMVETTGLADPGPVAQTFFVDPVLRSRLRLDSITTLVDARHSAAQMAASREAVQQIAFADQIVLNKIDLATEVELLAVRRQLHRINPLAPVHEAERARIAVSSLLGRGGFDLERIVALEPEFLHLAPGPMNSNGHSEQNPCPNPAHAQADHDAHPDHTHDGSIGSVSLQSAQPMDATAVERWLTQLVATHGADILRAKGIIHVAGDDRRLVFQSVHMILEGDWQRPWRADELRRSQLVFIGRCLDANALRAGLEGCAAPT